MNTKTTTKHRDGCKRIFGRYDLTCDRCCELRMGFGARRGWNDSARRFDAERIAAIRAHQCNPTTCGPVCTRFDW